MAVAISDIQESVSGNKKRLAGRVTFDDSYPTNGESITAAQLGLMEIERFQVEDSEGYVFDADIAAGGASLLLKAYRSATPSGSSAASVVTPGYHATVDGITVGTPALTHNGDPVGGLAAAPLFVVEAYGIGNKNIGVLQSNCNGTTSILGSTDDVSGACGAATPRFWVTHNATPAGVQIYVDEADNDKLVFISPTAKDCIVIMPFEAIANGVPGYAYAVTIHHKASMSGCKALYFDDNGAANAQLAFVDAGAAGGVIYASDIEVIAPQYTGITGNCGSAAGQTFTGGGAAALTEVGSGVNLSAIAVDFIALGY